MLLSLETNILNVSSWPLIRPC